jgi:hypothetical protein
MHDVNESAVQMKGCLVTQVASSITERSKKPKSAKIVALERYMTTIRWGSVWPLINRSFVMIVCKEQKLEVRQEFCRVSPSIADKGEGPSAS